MKNELINIAEITTQKPFDALFPVGEETLDAIKTDMAANGFDEVFPIIVWADKNIVVDGHTRFSAAKALDMEHVPVLFKEFDNEDDAILYCFHIQRNRRNLADEDILRCLEVLENINAPGKNNSDPETPLMTRKEEAKLRAKELGTSVNKIEKAKKVLDYGNDEIKKEVESGEKTINKAFQEVQDLRRESGELKGRVTTGLGDTAKYTQALGKYLKELTRAKEDGWQEVTQERALTDLAAIENLIKN